MWLVKLVFKGGAVLFLLVAAFGGVLDVTSLVGVSIPRSAAAIIALVLLVIDREVKVWTLDWQLARTRDLQRRIDKLAEFRKEAITSLYAVTPKGSEFTEWVARFDAWADSLATYLKEEFPYAVFEMLQDLGMIPAVDFVHMSEDPDIRDRHLHYLRMMAKRLTILERLIQENTGLTKEREPSLADLLSHRPGRG